jgi:hypothetical protein
MCSQFPAFKAQLFSPLPSALLNLIYQRVQLSLALGLLNRATLTFSVTTAMNGVIFNPIAQCGNAISALAGTLVMGTILGVREGPTRNRPARDTQPPYAQRG